MVYFAHNLIASWIGEAGENPALTRNRKPATCFACKSDYQP